MPDRGTTREAPEARRADGPASLLLVGRVIRAHGVQGEVKVLPETDDPARLLDLATVYLGARAEDARPQAVVSARLQPTRRGPLAILRLEGVDAREAADRLRSLQVYAREADLPPLAEDELFLHDLIGLQVETEEGEAVGVVKDVLEMPGQDLYVVAREGRPEVMIPAVPAFVAEVDLEAERLVIRPIEGLLDA